ncbi:hypothetical protein B0H67DRAFT_645221 [Lasiosphaeris hirsuta]|uniref:Uncharacterized protein n=1 Tax=Lasiosphaeris hirsuta TaxID=260670 RepID=A0AA40DTZ8_9PEZI|nr:hypothetical protein B0H67DRAFT_645221 [Lasiosphaeris hirsuta]
MRYCCGEASHPATKFIGTSTPSGPSVILPAPYPPDSAYPLSLTPARPDVSLAEITASIAALAASDRLCSLFDRYGAIYFQGLGLRDAHEFSQFTHAFGLCPHYPAYVLFYCVAASGGETPTNNSLVLYQHLRGWFPRFVDVVK